jgi:parvulin-like peptidyl-prolyl isomerase
MALMTKIRNNMGKAFGVFAGAFILYIIFDWGMDFTGRRHNTVSDELAVINGKKITYQEFSDAVRRAGENYKKQSGKELDEESERQLRTQVWNETLMNHLIDTEMNRLGIVVTDQEVVDMVRGPNPPDFLVQQFRDSTGRFNREAYERAILDPQNRQAWVQVEDMVRAQRRREKLQNLLFASVRVAENEILERFNNQNLTMAGEYALFDPNTLIPDSVANIQDNEIRKYFDEHQEDYKIPAARKISYVLFSTAPNAQDTQEVVTELTHLKDQVAQGVRFEELAKTYSEIPPTDAYFKHGELTREKEFVVFTSKVGQIYGPFSDNDGYHLVRVDGERKGKTEYIRASHILIRPSGSDSAAAMQKAKDLAKQVRAGADFAKLARENSMDGSAANGGDLGWSAKGAWVKSFEDAAWRARVGEIVGPIKTQFGWHIIKVISRDNREVKFTGITMKIKASSSTTDIANQGAQDFVYLAKDEGFEKAAETARLKINESPEFTKGGYIPGIGTSDAIMEFAFNEKTGSISEVQFVTGGYAVVKITFERNEGIRPFDEAKAFAKNLALREKKLRMIKERAVKFRSSLTPQSNLVDEAKKEQGAFAQTTGAFTPAGTVPGIGNDPAFIGVAVSMNVGEISNPFTGRRGYFVLKLTSKSALDTAKYAATRTGLRDQILQEKRNRMFSDWAENLKQQATIKDYRYKFYR